MTSSKMNYFLKVPSLNASCWGLGYQHRNLEGHKHSVHSKYLVLEFSNHRALIQLYNNHLWLPEMLFFHISFTEGMLLAFDIPICLFLFYLKTILCIRFILNVVTLYLDSKNDSSFPPLFFYGHFNEVWEKGERSCILGPIFIRYLKLKMFHILKYEKYNF